MTYETIEKLYWKIGEVAAMLNESEGVIRYWCREFEIITRHGSARTHGYDRLFTKDNLEKLKEIRRLLREELYTIAGTKKEIKLNLTPYKMTTQFIVWYCIGYLMAVALIVMAIEELQKDGFFNRKLF